MVAGLVVGSGNDLPEEPAVQDVEPVTLDLVPCLARAASEHRSLHRRQPETHRGRQDSATGLDNDRAVHEIERRHQRGPFAPTRSVRVQ